MRRFTTLLATLACIVSIQPFLCSASNSEHVFCDRLSPLVVRECPVAYPVCCIWPNGVFTACCPPHRMCDLYSGECVAMRNRTTGNSNGGNDDDHDVVPGVVGKPYDQGGVEVSLQFASSMVGVFFFGFLLLISMSIQYGKLMAHRREFARRQQELEARELLVANDAALDEEEEEDASAAAADEDDEERMCKVCFCNKMDCALVKCGHVVCCRWCAKKLAICPICREAVQHIVRLGHVESIRKAVDDSKTGNNDDAVVTVRPSPTTAAAGVPPVSQEAVAGSASDPSVAVVVVAPSEDGSGGGAAIADATLAATAQPQAARPPGDSNTAGPSSATAVDHISSRRGDDAAAEASLSSSQSKDSHVAVVVAETHSSATTATRE